MQIDIFSRITQSFEDWIHVKGAIATGFFANAVVFLAIATILYSVVIKVRGRSTLLLMVAVFVALLIAGALPRVDMSNWPEPISLMFIAMCLFLIGSFPIWLARMSASSRLGRFIVAVALYLILLGLFAANFVF